MRRGLMPIAREMLRKHEDGMSTPKLAEALGTSNESVRSMLKRMPDAYIDRWDISNSRTTAVWCVVVPPPNCPKPERK